MVQKGCICEICNCGRHKCPLHPYRPINNVPGECKVTEYNNKYRAYDIGAKPESFKPKPQLTQDLGKLDDATTFKTDYIQHPLQPKYKHDGAVYQKPDGSMDMITSYDKDYPQKPFCKTESSKRQQQYAGNDVPFEGLPTYKEDYKAWDGVRTKPCKKDGLYMPPSVPLDDATTSGTAYVPMSLPHTKSFKPDNMAVLSQDPFDDLTSHKANYISHPMPERFVRAKDPYCPSRVPLDSITTAQRDYIGHELPKNENFKPKNTGIRSEEPLDDRTEFKDSYKQWNLSRREPILKDAYVKPAGVMDGTTSHKNDYVQHKLQPTVSLKPHYQPSGNNAEFDDTTTFKTDYKAWQQPHHIRKPNNKEYELPTQPFEGMPTYKAHYTEKAMCPPRSFKPDNFIDANQAPFEGNTMYKSEYTLKQREPCPASNLPVHGYSFVQTNATGHQVYAK